MKKAIVLFSILFAFVCSINAQDEVEYHTDSRKAIKYFEQALEHMHSRQDDNWCSKRSRNRRCGFY